MKLLVFAPGIMGSVLRAEERVWPPDIKEVLLGYKRLDQLMSDDLEVSGIIRSVSFFGVYEKLLDDIQNCGYTTKQAGAKRLIPFPYDWRRGNAATSELLANELDAATEGIGEDDLEIFLLGHSMGGLVFRHLVESGLYNDRQWFNQIRWIAFLGTPHAGAAVALHRLAGKESILGLGGEDIKRLANDPRFPSLFELVGPVDSGLTTSSSFSNRIPEWISPFSSSLATSLGMNRENIESAGEFWNSLNVHARPDSIKYYSFVSSAHTTIVSNETTPGGTSILPIRRAESGDGTVPITGAVLNSVPHGYSSKKHQKIFLDRKVRQHLFRLLEAPEGVLPQSAPGSPDIDTPDTLGLSLNQESYEVGENLELGVSFTTSQIDPSVSFTIRELEPDSGEIKEGGYSHDFRVVFRGVSVTDFRAMIEIEIPSGIFELVSATASDDAEPTIFFVRDTNSENQ